MELVDGHTLAPPRERMKERKMRVPAIAWALLRFYHEAGEALEIVDCLHDSLAKKYQAKVKFYKGKDGKSKPGKITTNRKLKAIYESIDKPGALDEAKLVKCLIYNEIEDQVFGRLFGATGSKTVIDNVGRGIGFGPAL